MPGENGGELAGFLGEMMKRRLEAVAEGAADNAGRQVFGQLAARQMQEMPEYFKSGAPYGPTREGMMRWVQERAAAAQAAVEARPAEAAPAPKHASKHAGASVLESAPIRSFAEGDHIRSFAEAEHIHGVGEG